MSTTAFYGACRTCGVGYWADVVTEEMCGPTFGIVCQRHHPVTDVELRNSRMFAHEDRRSWEVWRKKCEAAFKRETRMETMG